MVKSTRGKPSSSRGNRSEQGRRLSDLKRAQKHHSILESERNRVGALAFKLGRLADEGEAHRKHWGGVLPRDTAEARRQPVERADGVVELTAPRLRLLQHLVETKRGKNFLEVRDGEPKLPIKPAARRKAQCTVGDADGVALLHPGIDDLDAAAVGLQLTEAHGQRLRREIFKSPQHCGDVRIERSRGDRMHCVRRCSHRFDHHLNDRIVSCAARQHLAVDVHAFRLEELRIAAAAADRRLFKRNGRVLRLGRDSVHLRARGLPCRGDRRSLAKIGDRHRSGEVSRQRRRLPDLGHQHDVLGFERERRLDRFDVGACIRAAHLDAKGEAADGLRRTGIDPSGLRLALLPRVRKLLHLPRRDVPAADPQTGEQRHQDGENERPTPPARGIIVLAHRVCRSGRMRRFKGCPSFPVNRPPVQTVAATLPACYPNRFAKRCGLR